ncbi:hypothetical protein ACQEUU_04245 [Nonomuraea sp. CA-218870]|uniref:hypothetical protein n=1 Tax=Nonomuraea sp. CA-218870 TaxID=3239998 RepID=UPI003D946AFE
MKVIGVPVQVWGAIALVLAVVWVVVWPQRHDRHHRLTTRSAPEGPRVIRSGRRGSPSR